MLVWINLYLILYTYLMLSLHIVLKRVISGSFNDKSLIFAHYYIIRFSKLKYIYILLLIALSGLPPFLLFFLKSNFIISIIGTISFYCNIIVFLSFFINMLFYTQLFLQKNYILDDIEFIDCKPEHCSYKIIIKIIGLLIITIFGIIFSPDLFFIINLLFS